MSMQCTAPTADDLDRTGLRVQDAANVCASFARRGSHRRHRFHRVWCTWVHGYCSWAQNSA